MLADHYGMVDSFILRLPSLPLGVWTRRDCSRSSAKSISTVAVCVLLDYDNGLAQDRWSIGIWLGRVDLSQEKLFLRQAQSDEKLNHSPERSAEKQKRQNEGEKNLIYSRRSLPIHLATIIFKYVASFSPSIMFSLHVLLAAACSTRALFELFFPS